MLIATAGHVDHGKTTLVRCLTGVDTDRLPEEQRRGLTIEAGFAHIDVAGGGRLSFVDVPGHERFIKNMVAGVGGIDLAVLVVAADDGVMPQTVEHFDILRLLAVRRMVLVVTKADAVAPGRSEEVVAEALELLQSGDRQAEAHFIVSAETGAGIEALKSYLNRAAEGFQGRVPEGYFRLPVDRTFVLEGVGIIATGTVFSGELEAGADLLLMPEGRALRARGLRTSDQPAARAKPGERCAINLVGDVSRGDIQRGHWLVAPAIGRAGNRLDVELFVLPSEAKALGHWTPVHCHHGAADITGRVAVLQGRQIEPGALALAQLVLDEPVNGVFGDPFILRDQSARRTIAGGRILDPAAPAKGRARPERLALIEACRPGDAGEALSGLLALSETGINFERFCLARNITAADRQNLLAAAAAVAAGRSHIFSAAHWSGLCTKITNAVAAFHQAKSGDVGINDRELLRQLRPRPAQPALQAALLYLRQSAALVRQGAVWRLPNHKAQPSEQEARLWARVGPELEAGDLRPPREREIAENLKISLQLLQGFLGRAVGLGLVWRVSHNRVYPRAALFRLARMAADMAENAEDGMFNAKQYRDVSGIGRNLTIELLEFFDRVGLTRRSGEGRRMVGAPEDLFMAPDEQDDD